LDVTLIDEVLCDVHMIAEHDWPTLARAVFKAHHHHVSAGVSLKWAAQESAYIQVELHTGIRARCELFKPEGVRDGDIPAP
jgi:hypothetical protein